MTWGASAKMLRISTQSLVFSAAKILCPILEQKPTCEEDDVAINNALRIVAGCLRPTSVFQLPVLAEIAPAGLQWEAVILALARKTQKYDWHILYDSMMTAAPPSRLKFYQPYSKAAQEILHSVPEVLF